MGWVLVSIVVVVLGWLADRSCRGVKVTVGMIGRERAARALKQDLGAKHTTSDIWMARKFENALIRIR